MEETVWQRFDVDDSIVPDEMKSRKLGPNDFAFKHSLTV